jgi:hypothetical protein
MAARSEFDRLHDMRKAVLVLTIVAVGIPIESTLTARDARA